MMYAHLFKLPFKCDRIHNVQTKQMDLYQEEVHSSCQFHFSLAFRSVFLSHYLQQKTLFYLSIARISLSNFSCEIIKSNTKEWGLTFNSILFTRTHTQTQYINGLAIFNIHKYFYKIFNSNVNYFVGHCVWATTIQPCPLTVLLIAALGRQCKKGRREMAMNRERGSVQPGSSTIAWTTYFTLSGRLTNLYVIHFRMPHNICNSTTTGGLVFFLLFLPLASGFGRNESIICLNMCGKLSHVKMITNQISLYELLWHIFVQIEMSSLLHSF